MTALPSPYNLGTPYPVMPAPPVPEHCVTIPAGDLELVVEARDVVDDLTRVNQTSLGFDDFGATLHVQATSDKVEHLRFDCFANEPHYHYIRMASQENLICRLDDVAEGDPIEWAIGRLRNRLPEMLEHVGAPHLARSVRADPTTIARALDAVQALLVDARARASARRASGATLAPPSQPEPR
jgi:hypothetical protein